MSLVHIGRKPCASLIEPEIVNRDSKHLRVRHGSFDGIGRHKPNRGGIFIRPEQHACLTGQRCGVIGLRQRLEPIAEAVVFEHTQELARHNRRRPAVAA